MPHDVLSPSALPHDLWFGDVPLSQWIPQNPDARTAEPWASFVQAHQALTAGDTALAGRTLLSIVNQPDLEARHTLQTWHALRELGVQPPATEAKRLLGVVVEVALEDGLEAVAAYSGYQARYLHYTGRMIFWDARESRIDLLIGQLLAAGERIVHSIGPWEGERPAPPPVGMVRLNLLTPSGLHFGQAPYGVLAQDSMGGPALEAAVAIMSELIERTMSR